DGLDELSTGAVNDVLGVTPDKVRASVIDPAELGFTNPGDDHIAGGDPAGNARVTRAVLGGVPGRGRDLVALSAGAALWLAGSAADIHAGVERGQRTIDEGAARDRRDAFVGTTQALGAA